MALPNPSSNSVQPPVGIDLGTTISVLAYIDDSGRPVTLTNGSGDLLTPSALLFEQGEVIVGKEAIRGGTMNPKLYVEGFKRDMGRASIKQQINGQDVPPEVLSAFVLKRLKQDAERKLGSIRQVVITVPAFFDEVRRMMTQEAGRLAGLEVLDLINEPTAAAVAYGYAQGFFDPTRPAAGSQRVLVYDLGGGTFDVTLLEIAGRDLRALATDGDVFLGGADFDAQLINHIAEQFLAQHGVDPRSDPQDAAQLWLDAREAKHALSERMKATVVCFHAGVRARIEITRQQLEDLTRPLLSRTETTTAMLVKQAGISWTDIDRVLLVGGSSRMPMVSDMLRRLTGKEPDRSQSPDEAVAQGAALYASLLMSEGLPASRACRLVNVNSHSLGVVGIDPQSRRKVNVIVIPKNTQLPHEATKTFKTAYASQLSVKVPVVEGESHRPEDCIALGECVVRDLPPGLSKGARIDVTYRYESNGRISVRASVPQLRYSAQVEIQRGRTKEHECLETWRSRLCGPAPDSEDRVSMLKRLDQLYAKVGEAGRKSNLPQPLMPLQQAVGVAEREFDRLTKMAREADAATQSAVNQVSAMRSQGEVAQARTASEQARVRLEFARITLGRQCVERAVALPQLGDELDEIGRLRHFMK